MRKSLALLGAALFMTVAPVMAATQLTGAGSTFDYPFFSKAFFEYGKTHSDVQVNYQSIGSGGGIQQFTQRTVDFGATDVPMNAGEVKAASAGGGPVLQIPVALAGVSVVYNLPGIGGGLRLSPSVLADLFLGTISNWNDARIAKLNPGKKLPSTPVVVVHRSDGSGTTYIFTDYVSSVSSDWKSKVGTGKSVTWPAQSAIGGKGSEGLAGQVTNNPGAIGYVEAAYALQNKMSQAVLQNAAGKFVAYSPSAVHAAAETRPDVSPEKFSIVNAKCAACYPIAGFSWAVVYQNPQDKAKGKVLQQILEWLVGAGAQRIAGGLDYVPLPTAVGSAARKTLSSMHV
ncbi:MAG: phosphate ABC transporter substrate-binding protein PstS [Candidatus Tumulicola sp.]